jgi:hypothetical protein
MKIDAINEYFRSVRAARAVVTINNQHFLLTADHEPSEGERIFGLRGKWKRLDAAAVLELFAECAVEAEADGMTLEA